MSVGPLTPVAAPEAPLGRGDPTRRHAVGDAAGGTWFPGLTRPEAEAVAVRGLADLAPARVLVRIALPVLLSDGAGPHLADAEGRLTLVVGPHPAGADLGVAMAEPRAGQRVGVVRPLDEDRLRWTWVAAATVAEDARVAALDGLLAADDLDALAAWEREWGPAPPGDAS